MVDFCIEFLALKDTNSEGLKLTLPHRLGKACVGKLGKATLLVFKRKVTRKF